MGDKTVDWDYVSDLGQRIQRSADDTVPEASRRCANAQDIMMGAGQGGGLVVVVTFFFAAAFLEESLKRKQEVAGELNEGAQATSRHWEATERVNTIEGF